MAKIQAFQQIQVSTLQVSCMLAMKVLGLEKIYLFPQQIYIFLEVLPEMEERIKLVKTLKLKVWCSTLILNIIFV